MKMRQVNFHLYGTLSEGGLQPQLWALQEVMNNSLVSYKDPEYLGLQNIEWVFHGEPALKEGYKNKTLPSSSTTNKPFFF